ncbi:MAG: ATP-binding cassette domain-containing protein [Microthrixaceae bacterium]
MTVVGRLEEVTLRVAPGSITAVVGGDGAGKSTLMRVLAGALAPDSGEVRTPPRRTSGSFQPTPVPTPTRRCRRTSASSPRPTASPRQSSPALASVCCT